MASPALRVRTKNSAEHGPKSTATQQPKQNIVTTRKFHPSAMRRIIALLASAASLCCRHTAGCLRGRRSPDGSSLFCALLCSRIVTCPRPWLSGSSVLYGYFPSLMRLLTVCSALPPLCLCCLSVQMPREERVESHACSHHRFWSSSPV